jgi:hypothetical protein
MEICREEDRSGGANEGGRRRKGGGRERGEKGLFFVLDLGLVGPLYFGLGHQNIWARNSRSGDTFPLINCLLSFFGRGRMVPGNLSLNGTGAGSAYQAPEVHLLEHTPQLEKESFIATSHFRNIFFFCDLFPWSNHSLASIDQP